MESDFQHKILVVDDDEQIRKAFNRILRAKNFDPAFANNGEQALHLLSETKTIFSLIISDQGMGEMRGTQFLEKAKQICPNTIRFLMTEHASMETIINAVNKGAIHRYITKPWDDAELLLAISSGIKLFEAYLENRKLIRLAKQQNTKLYDLNCELMEMTKSHNMDIQALDLQIESVRNQMAAVSHPQTNGQRSLSKEIIAWINTPTLDPEDKNSPHRRGRLAKLYSESIMTLFEQFKETAHQSGFEMPEFSGDR